MRSRKHYIQTRLLPLRAPRKERATLLLHLSKDMPTMKTLIPRIHLLPTLAPLTWGLTLNLVVTLVSKVPHLMHLLQSSQDLAWQMSSLVVSLVIQIPVWLVVPTSLFIIVLCHHSLTHPCTPDQDRIGLHRLILPRQMINRRQGLKILRTPFFSFFMIVDKGGRRIGLKLQEVSPKVLGVERISSVSLVS
jgi:hypothetical protein